MENLSILEELFFMYNVLIVSSSNKNYCHKSSLPLATLSLHIAENNIMGAVLDTIQVYDIDQGLNASVDCALLGTYAKFFSLVPLPAIVNPLTFKLVANTIFNYESSGV